MTASVSGLEGILACLGGWPDYFGDLERLHGQGMMALQLRRRSLDEAVFGIVIRYAVARAEYDRISEALVKDRTEEKDSEFLSGREQKRATYRNELLTLERELLVTPSSKVRADMSLQTDFLDQLETSEDEENGGKVVPWKPISRGGR